MRRRTHTLLWFFLATLSGVITAQQPGVSVTVRDANGNSISQISDAIAIVGRGSMPFDRRLAAGPIRAEFNGLLLVQQSGTYRFGVDITGKARVSIGDREFFAESQNSPRWVESDLLELTSGFTPIRVEYESIGDESTNDESIKKDEASFRLYWAGPDFEMIEPVVGRFLFHEPKHPVANGMNPENVGETNGGDLAQAFRCNACHEFDGRPTLRTPSLEELSAESMRPNWLVNWLVNGDSKNRHCPTYGFNREQATAIALDLIPDTPVPQVEPSGNADEGEVLFSSIGCLACHRVERPNGESLGTASAFGGGDLSNVASKRPAAFFDRWLKSPVSINPDHRMPVFELSKTERADLATYLATLREPRNLYPTVDASGTGELSGAELIRESNCAACHNIPGRSAKPTIRIDAWNKPCSTTSNQPQPQFAISQVELRQIRKYVEQVRASKKSNQPHRDHARNAKTSHELLIENNCYACHARGLLAAKDLTSAAMDAVEQYPSLAGQYAALLPPSLNQVGDKLSDKGLRNAILRYEKPLRPWLRIRMPKFRLSDEELEEIVAHFPRHDRIPAAANRDLPFVQNDRDDSHNGGRLIGPAGFNCLSCHALGEYQPVAAPIASRGPNLAAVVGRVRPTWFARWVRNPIRIVPNVEMPSISVPVKGVLGEDLNRQVASIWNTVRDPRFKIPKIQPFRVLRQNETSEGERPIVLTDVLKLKRDDDGLDTFLKPFVVGLANRHNVLFDLGAGGLAGWWIGDVASQVNNGKRWYWQAHVRNLLVSKTPPTRASDLVILDKNNDPILPVRRTSTGRETQFITRADRWRHTDAGTELNYRLRFPGERPTSMLQVRRTFSSKPKSNGFTQTITCSSAADNVVARLNVASNIFPLRKSVSDAVSQDKTKLTLPSGATVKIVTDHEFAKDGTIFIDLGTSRQATLCLEYSSNENADFFASVSTEPGIRLPREPQTMNVVPGFAGHLLPIDEPFMPTGLSWTDDGTLFVSSLDGRVWRVVDTNADGFPDHANLFSDELSTPYGVVAEKNYVDVVDKTALLRLRDTDQDGRADETQTLADGWGHTDDYHDWVVGLERDPDGNYFVALPCQQDDRSESAAYLRGKVLQLSPRVTSTDQPSYEVRKLTGGHRFPHGVARNRDGDLFVTDNQGNFNPFNELNHVVAGRRYGFINRLEQKPGFEPELTSPAINIPHPWTRSVNGICFLETPSPDPSSDSTAAPRFGPFEGHIVGCEYDTRRLVRMSLQRIEGEYQGAVFPFSLDAASDGRSIPGPIICKVAPDGDLYVGSLRESGWGGGRNTGEIVRLSPRLDEIPTGIADIRVTADGFALEFTGPVERALAMDAANYQIMSYRRISTPVYGGEDVDRRQERIAAIDFESTRRIHICFRDELRVGYVYEFRLRKLNGESNFFPAEGFYTLNRRPS